MIGGIESERIDILPSKASNGKKAIQVVVILAAIGRSMYPVPSTAASSGATPLLLRRMIFSETTIASSTIMPMTIITAASVTLLMVNPHRLPAMIVTQKVKGIPRATHIPVLKFKNRKRVARISAKPIRPL